MLKIKTPFVVHVPSVYVNGSRSISDPARPQVRINPLLVRMFPVILYEDPDAVGASLVQIILIVIFPVPESAPL